MKRIKAIIIIALILLGKPDSTVFSKNITVPFYNEWTSNQCNYVPEKPFSLIKNSLNFHNFWKKSGINEPEPFIDFSKYMVFLWIPGNTLFDQTETQIEKIYYKNNAYQILMDFKKKNAGNWLKPVLVTILPKRENVDFFFFEKAEKGFGKPPEWKHIYSLWDMSTERVKPFAIVKVDKKPISQNNFIVTELIPDEYSKNKATLQVNTSEAHKPIISETKPTKIHTHYTPINKPDDSVDSISELFSGSKQKDTYSSSSKPLPALMNEDPLFGSEFDITF